MKRYNFFLSVMALALFGIAVVLIAAQIAAGVL